MTTGRRLTDHHQVPESFGGTRARSNLFRFPENKHQAFHLIFDNRTFIGQLLRLEHINHTSLSRQVQDDVFDLVSQYRGEKELYAYKDGVLVPERFLMAQQRFYNR